ncbi:MAG TPA: hypothetical protein VFI45_02880 [Candidatus Acidoferrum sp.]|nr:hypothetical protein [Candidatus Acidoferrum sp.]
MDKLTVDLENCYGIRKLQHEFNFLDGNVFAIYAPNGSMKTSFADTFNDFVSGRKTVDRYFPDRICKNSAKDEANADLPPTNILVVRPFVDQMPVTEKTSALLVNGILRDEYVQLCSEVEASKGALLAALGQSSGLKKDIDKELSLAVTSAPNRFYESLIQLKLLVERQKDAPFASVPYQLIFNETVLKFLESPEARANLELFVERYNLLIGQSRYFKKGMFEYHHAKTIADQLEKQGFFDAKHTVHLNANDSVEIITTKAELEKLIKNEQDEITNDKELRKQFAKLSDQSVKNEALRAFRDYALSNSGILPHLLSPTTFKQDVWRSYLKVHFDVYQELMAKFDSIEKRKAQIEEEAGKEKTKWDEVIAEFNDRFIVPFTLVPKNKAAVVLKDDPILSLGFIFKDKDGEKTVEQPALMGGLSRGELKAYYVLNIIFEVTVRKESGAETLMIVDDVADSFDYKNKYAIVEYLKDIASIPFFKLVILTHNFDFYRSLHLRGIVPRTHCLMAYKTDTEVTLVEAKGLRNIFVKVWKPQFVTNGQMRVSSIAFMRNLIEFKDGSGGAAFKKLTSLLHYKPDSETILQSDLDDVYNKLFSLNVAYPDANQKVLDMIRSEADQCLKAGAGINLEHKIVLSIAIRLAAEQFMLSKMPLIDAATIKSNQTAVLLDEFIKTFPNEAQAIRIIRKVVLMTPESIHLNSFMYEPILDMSDDHLRKLYQEVKNPK